ncbi:MAG: hypothetical protein DSZ02_03525 [Gammaproteobacteria bacterium]|nr:MAG: hypothetical protein DSZ02_03525 [Gammaproteobacteria bacterium]
MTSDSGRDHGKSTSIMVIEFKHDLKWTSSNYLIVQVCQWVIGLDDVALPFLPRVTSSSLGQGGYLLGKPP